MRGVIAHVKARYDEGVRLFGVLDTVHSQAGHAVALACRELGVRCVNFFPVYKADIRTDPVPNETPVGAIKILDGGVWTQLRDPQLRSSGLGAELAALKAGRSAVLFHAAKKAIAEVGGYMMPNALKLPEMVQETADEVVRTFEHASREEYRFLRSNPWIIAASSGTIAAGVVRGLATMLEGERPKVFIHMGYNRPREAVRKYIFEKAAVKGAIDLSLIDEGYGYADKAKPGETPPWPCNAFYDLKAFRWWLRSRREGEQAVLWNIG
jgi:threonine dehydratase